MHSFTFFALLAYGGSLCSAAPHIEGGFRYRREFSPSGVSSSSASFNPTSPSGTSSTQPPGIQITSGQIQPSGTASACSTITTTIGTRVDIIPVPCATSNGGLPETFTEVVIVEGTSASLQVGPSGSVSVAGETVLSQPSSSTTAFASSTTSALSSTVASSCTDALCVLSQALSSYSTGTAGTAGTTASSASSSAVGLSNTLSIPRTSSQQTTSAGTVGTIGTIGASGSAIPSSTIGLSNTLTSPRTSAQQSTSVGTAGTGGTVGTVGTVGTSASAISSSSISLSNTLSISRTSSQQTASVGTIGTIGTPGSIGSIGTGGPSASAVSSSSISLSNTLTTPRTSQSVSTNSTSSSSAPTNSPSSSIPSATSSTVSASASSASVSEAPTSASASSSAGASITSYPCYHAADPDRVTTGLGWCECNGYTQTFPLMSSTGANTGTAYQPCAYTSVPPLPSSSSIPTSTVPSSTSAVSNALPTQCTDGANPDASCFNALDLPDYLIHWWSANSDSCGQQGFAACFYAKQTKYAPSDCGQLNNDAACTEPVWNDFVGTVNGPENFYVAWNIWNTNGFFLDLYNAIGAAEGSASAGLSAIVTLLDPPKKENVVLNDILDALTFGLSLYSEGTILVKALLRSAPQTASLLGKLFPSGTVDGEYQDWSLVSQNLGKVTDAYRASVAEGLPMVENNVTAFIVWSQNSGLSGFRPSLNGLVGSMTQALNTYAISQIITTQGIVVSRAPDTDVHALQTNGSKLNWDTGCSGGYTAGICDTFFWDGTDTYGLTDPDHFKKNFHDELTSFFVGTPPLTTGELLFTGAQQCLQATGKNGGGSPAIDSTDPTQFSCLSNMQVCTWTEDGFGPFDNCPNLPSKDAVLGGFGVSGCIGSTDSTTSIDVPHAYLGPGVYQDARGIPDLQVDSFCDNIDY